jgi:hypothetical protein
MSHLRITDPKPETNVCIRVGSGHVFFSVFGYVHGDPNVQGNLVYGDGTVSTGTLVVPAVDTGHWQLHFADNNLKADSNVCLRVWNTTDHDGWTIPKIEA